MVVSTSKPRRKAWTRARPSASVSSPAARAAASTGAEGWPIMAKLVSSKSSACAAVPLARAAHTAPVRSGVPTTVARGEPPSARATSVTRRAAGSTEPASITPRQSRMARRAASTASAGQSSQRLFVTNSARCEVARMAESLAQVCYHLPMALARSVLFLAALSFFVVPVPASAQIFIASVADPSFAVGPLTIRATEQDIFLLWPGEVSSPLGDSKGDKTLEKYVETRGFSVVGSGRLPLYVQNIYGEGVEAAPKSAGEAPYVTFVQDSSALGLSPPGTWIRIPWTPQMPNVTFMTSLRMRVSGAIKPGQGRWFETLFTGERHLFTISYNEVRDRPIFPMYAEHRDRALRLAEAPAELAVHFAQAEHLRIEQVYPPTSTRRLSQSLESTEVVSLFMGSGEGVVPQHLSVQFGYFSKLQGLMIVVIPLLLLAAGPALGPIIGRSAVALLGRLRSRLHLGVPGAKILPRERGVLLGRQVLERIVPGRTTREEVLRMCGTEVEEEERTGAPDRSVLVYRGWRAEPETRQRMRWVATVEAWAVLAQEARIEIEHGLVKDVQVRIRRSRGPNPEPQEST